MTSREISEKERIIRELLQDLKITNEHKEIIREFLQAPQDSEKVGKFDMLMVALAKEALELTCSIQEPKKAVEQSDIAEVLDPLLMNYFANFRVCSLSRKAFYNVIYNWDSSCKDEDRFRCASVQQVLYSAAFRDDMFKSIEDQLCKEKFGIRSAEVRQEEKKPVSVQECKTFIAEDGQALYKFLIDNYDYIMSGKLSDEALQKIEASAEKLFFEIRQHVLKVCSNQPGFVLTYQSFFDALVAANPDFHYLCTPDFLKNFSRFSRAKQDKLSLDGCLLTYLDEAMKINFYSPEKIYLMPGELEKTGDESLKSFFTAVKESIAVTPEKGMKRQLYNDLNKIISYANEIDRRYRDFLYDEQLVEKEINGLNEQLSQAKQKFRRLEKEIASDNLLKPRVDEIFLNSVSQEEYTCCKQNVEQLKQRLKTKQKMLKNLRSGINAEQKQHKVACEVREQVHGMHDAIGPYIMTPNLKWKYKINFHLEVLDFRLNASNVSGIISDLKRGIAQMFKLFHVDKLTSLFFESPSIDAIKETRRCYQDKKPQNMIALMNFVVNQPTIDKSTCPAA